MIHGVGLARVRVWPWLGFAEAARNAKSDPGYGKPKSYNLGISLAQVSAIFWASVRTQGSSKIVYMGAEGRG